MKISFNNLFTKHILDRGYEYFIEGKVGDVHHKDGVHYATVNGANGYHVEIEIKDDTILNMNCNCSYSELKSCKHMAALLYKIQGIDDLHSIKPSNEEDTNNEWIKILQKIPRKELTAFLVETMKQDVVFQNELTSHFSMYFPSDVNSYLLEWANIVSNAEGWSGFIDYQSSFDFEHDSNELLCKVENLILQQPRACFHVCSSIYYDFADLKMDDSNGCTTTLRLKIQEILLKLLRCGKADVIQEIRLWLHDSIYDPKLQDYGLDDGLDTLYIESTPLPERIELLKELIAKNGVEDYDLHCGNHVDSLINAFRENNMKDDQIYIDILPYKQFTPARNWIIQYLLNLGSINEAIEYIKEGSCVDHWDEHRYMKWLIDVYEDHGFTKAYEIELRVYIASDARDAFDFYKRYRKQFKDDNWEATRDQLLQSIKKKNILANCFYLERMGDKLAELIKLKNLDFSYLQNYEDLLLEYDRTWVLEMYMKECDDLCKAAENWRYERIAQLLLHLKKLPDGEQLANQKRDEIAEKYRRRPNLVKLMKSV